MTSGLLVLDKPAGLTSNRLVSTARRMTGVRKVGHAGTLDPMATGVMLLGVGKGTRLLGHLLLANKTYTATMRLGISTVSDDADGEVVATPGCWATLAEVTAQLEQFRGVITQVPSAVSAIKVAGKRAYDLVRAGQEVVLKSRQVEVSRFEVLAARRVEVAGVPVLDLDVVVDCSTGTYIRALARDLGVAVGSVGHLTALRRTRVGPFGVDEVSDDLIDLATVARRFFPVVEVDDFAASEVSFGRSLALGLDFDTVAIIHDGQLLALYHGDGRPEAVLI